MKLKEITANIVVHTPTEEEANELLQILHENGWKWLGEISLEKGNNWDVYFQKTCYELSPCKTVCYADDRFYIEKGYTILTLSDFKRQYCKEEKSLTEENPFKIGDGVMFADDCADNNIHIVEEIEGMNIIIDDGKVYPSELFVLFERKNEKSAEKIKLKPVPQNTVVRTPTKEEANELLKILHENGYKWCGGASLTETTEWDDYEVATCYYISSDVEYGNIHEYNKDKSLILTLTEFKEKYVLNEDSFVKSENNNPQPKFNKGDWVVYKGKPYLVQAVTNMGNYFLYSIDTEECDHLAALPASELEPYTESEAKPTKFMNPEYYPPYLDRPKTVVEVPNKDLNLCELLRGHEGEEIFLTTMGTVIVDGISEENIRFKLHKTSRDTYLLLSNGKMRNSGTVIAFPSYALYEKYPLGAYTAWMEWDKEQKTYPLRFVCRKGDDEA